MLRKAQHRPRGERRQAAVEPGHDRTLVAAGRPRLPVVAEDRFEKAVGRVRLDHDEPRIRTPPPVMVDRGRGQRPHPGLDEDDVRLRQKSLFDLRVDLLEQRGVPLRHQARDLQIPTVAGVGDHLPALP
jgi:hypothetical protein